MLIHSFFKPRGWSPTRLLCASERVMRVSLNAASLLLLDRLARVSRKSADPQGFNGAKQRKYPTSGRCVSGSTVRTGRRVAGIQIAAACNPTPAARNFETLFWMRVVLKALEE